MTNYSDNHTAGYHQASEVVLSDGANKVSGKKACLALKQKIVLGMAVILVCCMCGYAFLESKIQQTRQGVNDEILTDIYKHITQANEQLHTQLTGKQIQKLAGLPTIVDMTVDGVTENNVKVAQGFFLTMEGKTDIERMIIADRNFSVLVNEAKKSAIPYKNDFMQSDTIAALAKQAAETWESHGAMLYLGNTPVFAIVTAIFDDDDNVAGYVAGILHVKYLAETLVKRIDGHVSYADKNAKLFYSTDNAIQKAIDAIGSSNIALLQSFLVKTENKTFLTHAVPIFAEESQPTRASYYVCRDFSEGQALIHKLAFRRMALVSFLILAGVATAFVLLGRLFKPLLQVRQVLDELSRGEGDLTKRIKIKCQDEVGSLAASFNIFAEKIRTIVSQIADNAGQLDQSSSELAEISEKMTSSADQTASQAETVSSATEQMSTNLMDVTAAMEQTSSNAQAIASTSEEINATINEIATNAAKARTISADASQRSEQATRKLSALDKAAQAIGRITETITEISEQTNLLALNATIEAARAGESGKGFTVVANEIKELAKQTATATLDIKKQIEEVQSTTSASVNEINQISDVIVGVNETVGVIAVSVEEQSKATQEIAGNIAMTTAAIQDVFSRLNQTSDASNEISRSISEVNYAAGDFAQGSGQVNLSAEQMNRTAATLRNMVNRFKI